MRNIRLLLAASIIAASAASAQASTVLYDLTFNNSLGSVVGTAQLALNLSSPTFSGNINSSNDSGFVSLTGTLLGDSFSVTQTTGYGGFDNIFITSGITLVNGNITNIVTPYGGQGIGASGPSSSGFFFFNPTASEPGLSFTFTPSGETTTAGTVSSEVAAVPEPSTWAMMILGFFGVGFMAYRRKAKPTFMAA
jgi:hypothetical protein